MAMKNSIRFILLLVLLQILLAGCIHIEPMHSGTIMDAETKNPLRDSVAYIDISYKCYGYALYSPHVGHEELDSYEVLSDSDGRYRLPFKFYIIPPFLCFTENYFKFFKVGYFTKTEITNSGEVYLQKMTRYLNYLPYKDTSHIEEKSQFLKTEIKEFNKTKLVPQDDVGVFLRFPGKAITRIYSRKMLYYVQDSLSMDWLAFDDYGNKIGVKKDQLPHWDFISTDILCGYTLYASKDVIFYPVEENPVPAGLQYTKGEIKYIPAKIGNITSLVGTFLDFFTFEGNGKAMCNYGSYYDKKTKDINTSKDNPYLRKCYTSAELLASAVDNTIANSNFEFVVDTLNHGMFIVTRTHRYWHIYKFGYTNEPNRKFTEIYALPIDKEITAFTATGNEFFIAFKKEGLKKYDIIGSSAKEDTGFASKARMARGLNITSLVAGWAVNMPVLYATTGDDKIYRFSKDGIPDYIVKQ